MQPMTDDQLDRKFTGQCVPVLGAQRTADALACLRRIQALDDVRDCASACAAT